MLVTGSTSNFGEEVFMPPIDGEISVRVTSRFFFKTSFCTDGSNVPGAIHGLRSVLLYTFLV